VKKITLKGAGSAQTIINGARIASSAHNAVITGFTLKAPSSADTIIDIKGKNWRIYNNRIESTTTNTKSEGVHARGTSEDWGPYGLIDENIFVNARIYVSGSAQNFSDGDGTNQHELWARALDLGGPSAVYIENNTFEMTAPGNVIDGNYGGSYVARFNTITSPGEGYVIEVHSVQGNNRAAKKWEFYYNTIYGSTKAGSFFIRGGTGVAFNNALSGTFEIDGLIVDNVRSFDAVGDGGLCDGDSPWDGNQDATGWPCRDQIGRGPDNPRWDHRTLGAYTQPSMPAYMWSNTNPGGGNLAVAVGNNSNRHIKPNRDYFHFSSATGSPQTVGVQVGTFANRPAGCTTGVGYWATDQGNWNQSGRGGQGVLYKCTSTNTWTLYYIPYTYPHPLVSGGPTTGRRPNPPNNVRIE
jgi:hypothetical protein